VPDEASPIVAKSMPPRSRSRRVRAPAHRAPLASPRVRRARRHSAGQAAEQASASKSAIFWVGTPGRREAGRGAPAISSCWAGERSPPPPSPSPRPRTRCFTGFTRPARQ
jgi:hypothetical protein